MSFKRVWILIKNELLHGTKDVILVMSIVIPVLLALFANLAFGNIFTDRASLGIFDAGNSQLPVILDETESISLKIYDSETDLQNAAMNGAIDMGILLPSDFDQMLESDNINLKAYIWGESLAKNRAIIPIALTDAVREIKGTVLPLQINTVAIGDTSSMPWNDRLMPMVILTAIFFGGMMIPASSLINEKNRHTMEALNVSPATITDIFVAKGIIGVILATFMGIMTLLISGSFNSSFLALILVLWLGAIMAVEIGLMAGAFIKDMNTLFALWKFGGILLFGPAIVYMFPQIPQWIGYIFPTFYVTKPVVDLTVNGLGFSSIIVNLVFLIAIILVLGLILGSITRRLSTRALSTS
jgi:ABC-2 type transport system permease protein